ERSAALLEESLTASRATGDASTILRAVSNLAETSNLRDDYQRATVLLEESQSIARALGDTWAVAQACRHLGLVAYRQGDLDRAVILLEEAIERWREVHATRGPQWA